MKIARTLLTAALFSASILLSAATFASAQGNGNKQMRVDIPFEFQAVKANLPAGHYIVRETGTYGLLEISNVDGRHSALLRTSPEYSRAIAEKSMLTFRRAGPQYSLVQVQAQGYSTKMNVWHPKPAKEWAKEGSGGIETLVADAQ